MGYFLKYIYMGKHLSIFPSLTLGAETPYSSGFGGGKMILIGVKDAIWAEKSVFL